MELRAVLDLLRATHADVLTVVVADDKTMSVLAALDEWREHKWRAAGGQRLSDLDLLLAVDAEVQSRTVTLARPTVEDQNMVGEAERLARAAASDAAEEWLRE